MSPDRPTAALVAVGNELLFGETVDTNSAWLGRTLSSWGITVVGGETVRDRGPEIREALERAMDRARIVVVTGGLGPTRDDLTKAVASETLDLGLVRDRATERRVAERFAASGDDVVPQASRGQADVLEGCTVLENDRGTAPGMLVDREGSAVVLLPGVPAEMKSIVDGPLRRELQSLGLTGPSVAHRTVRTTGLEEPRVAERVDPAWEALIADVGNVLTLAYLPGGLGVDLRVTSTAGPAEATRLLDRAERALTAALPGHVYHSESGDLADGVTARLRERGLTIATAESCTAGLVARRLTETAGASDVFRGGVVAYDNEVKRRLLGVRPESLDRYGAVSEAVAAEMARGALRSVGASIAVSVTGVAGPGGGTEEKPVGTVWIAVAREGWCQATRNRFAGDRRAVRRKAAQAALAAVYRALGSVDSAAP